MVDQSRIPLIAEQWRDLPSFAEDTAFVPLSLAKLVGGAAPTEAAFWSLAEALVNEGTACPAAVAALPILADLLADRSDGAIQIVGLAANIAASVYEGVPTVPVFLERVARFGFQALKARAIELLVSGSWNDGEVQALIIGALGFSGHCCGLLVTDGFDPVGTARTTLICPECGHRFFVAVLAEGLVALSHGVPCGEASNVPLIDPPNVPLTSSKDAQWNRLSDRMERRLAETPPKLDEHAHIQLAIQICSMGLERTTSIEQVFSVIGAAIWAFGSPAAQYRRFLRMWDDVACPGCDAHFLAARGWWGCAKGRFDIK